jgi:ribose transport system substrate-binding protein
LAHKAADNFVAAPRLFDRADINTDGGKQDTYVPNDNYKGHYKAIWGVK